MANEACDVPGQGLRIPPSEVPDPETDIAAADDRGELVLAGGCFWCTEAVYRQLAGVTEVLPGYAGGSADTADQPPRNLKLPVHCRHSALTKMRRPASRASKLLPSRRRSVSMAASVARGAEVAAMPRVP